MTTRDREGPPVIVQSRRGNKTNCGETAEQRHKLYGNTHIHCHIYGSSVRMDHVAPISPLSEEIYLYRYLFLSGIGVNREEYLGVDNIKTISTV